MVAPACWHWNAIELIVWPKIGSSYYFSSLFLQPAGKVIALVHIVWSKTWRTEN